MAVARKIAWALVLGGIATGTITDRSPQREPLELGGYRVLSGDFHVHPAPLSGSTIAPWDLALEARRQGLDVLAVTPQNGAVAGRIAEWFSKRIGGPTIIPGEEIHGPRFHMIGLGIREYVDWRLDAAEAIAQVHRQGGVAIAAHPVHEAWPALDPAASQLDGAEVSQPIASVDWRAAELETFWRRSGAAAIGSSDWHGMGPLGVCRTYLFVRENSEAGVLEAIRARRTVVIRDGRAFGDPSLTGYAPLLPPAPERPSRARGMCVVAGLAALLFLKR
jgi:hypothetical protein